SKAAALLGSARTPLAWRPQIVHCHDWPAALAPVYLKLEQGVPCAVTIHNIAFQGNYDASLLSRLELPPSVFTVDGIEFYGRLSFLKGGIVYADAITTVSPTYAREIQTPEFGFGLDGLLRQRRDALTGILNGIDAAAWNPATDPLIPRRYHEGSLEAKAANKRSEERRVGK